VAKKGQDHQGIRANWLTWRLRLRQLGPRLQVRGHDGREVKGIPVQIFSAMAKYFASDTAMKVTTEVVQIMQWDGVVRRHPVERMMRDAKILQIYEGTNQVQRMVVAHTLQK